MLQFSYYRNEKMRISKSLGPQNWTPLITGAEGVFLNGNLIILNLRILESGEHSRRITFVFYLYWNLIGITNTDN